jgi:hypothetical protein
MIARHVRAVDALIRKLRALESSKTDLALLLGLQLELVRRIKSSEKAIKNNQGRIAATKRILKTERRSKAEALKLKASIRRAEKALDNHKWMLFIWRTVGDAVAFLYLDKWAIKPLMYEVESRAVKQSAGFLTGKLGLRNELRLLRRVVGDGVPALLTDLTNCIRHGDLCLLVGPDPRLVEVKSSGMTNSRVGRQLGNIRSIHDYHATDKMQRAVLPCGPTSDITGMSLMHVSPPLCRLVTVHAISSRDFD